MEKEELIEKLNKCLEIIYHSEDLAEDESFEASGDYIHDNAADMVAILNAVCDFLEKN